MRVDNENRIAILDEKDFTTVDFCPCCSSQRVLYQGDLPKKTYIKDYSIIVDIVIGYGISLCESCGLYFKTLITTPGTEIQLQRIWNSDESLRWHKGSVSGVADLVRIIDEVCQENLQMDKVELVDIGVGEGDFVRLFSEKYNVSGIELNADLGEKSENSIPIHIGNIEKDGISQDIAKRFDVITALDLFEHFSDPDKAIKNIYQLLNENGLLVLETGNIDVGKRTNKKVVDWWYILIAEHKIFWSEKAIKNKLETEGFETILIRKKQHKGQKSLDVKSLIKNFIYCLSPMIYSKISGVEITKLRKPKFPRKDHLLVVAKKKTGK